MRQVNEQQPKELELWEYQILNAKLEKQNFDLKNLINHKNDEYRALKAAYNSLDQKYKQLTQHRKPRYRNKGKKRV